MRALTANNSFGSDAFDESKNELDQRKKYVNKRKQDFYDSRVGLEEDAYEKESKMLISHNQSIDDPNMREFSSKRTNRTEVIKKNYNYQDSNDRNYLSPYNN